MSLWRNVAGTALLETPMATRPSQAGLAKSGWGSGGVGPKNLQVQILGRWGLGLSLGKIPLPLTNTMVSVTCFPK